MKNKFVGVCIFILFTSCSSNKVDKEAASKYYGQIERIYASQIDPYHQIIDTINSVFTAHRENGKKSDSIRIANLHNEYSSFLARMENDRKTLSEIPEVDPELNLKGTIIKHLESFDSSMIKIMPDFLRLLELDSVPTTFEAKLEELRIATEQQEQREKYIEDLSVKFLEKHNLD